MAFDRKRMYETRVKPEEIVYLVKEMARLHEDGQEPDFYSALAILALRYKTAKGKPISQKPFCIMERLQCLTNLMKDERMRGWSLKGIEEDCMLTNAAVFTATALCTLKEDGTQSYFDADEFFDIVLSESETEGRA